ncbi:hypothetical protein Tco_0149238 [Tanacetum coccineum]
MIEPEVPLKRKDQVDLDEEMARNLEAQLQDELIEEEKMERKKEEEANIALIKSWENTQAMKEADRLLVERLQTREQEEFTAQEISGKKDESSSKKTEIAQDSSAKRAGDKLESDESKKQKIDENEEVEEDNKAELKKHQGLIRHYQLIRADGSSKRYSSMIRMLQGIDREDLQTLWKLVKTKHGDIRPED